MKIHIKQPQRQTVNFINEAPVLQKVDFVFRTVYCNCNIKQTHFRGINYYCKTLKADFFS